MFDNDPRPRLHVQEILKLLRHQRFVVADRRVGKTSAIILLAYEMDHIQNNPPMILALNQQLAKQMREMWTPLTGQDYRKSRVLVASRLNAFRGQPKDRPLLVDEFLLHADIGSVPNWAGFTFYAGTASCDATVQSFAGIAK